MIIGVCGLMGSGKNTVADYLIERYGFQQESFAGALKDAVSVIFGWDREMLEGLTDESRQWREQTDSWWANRLNIPYLTPRWVLQQWGTNVLRDHFHDDIWIASVEKRLTNTTSRVIITDMRFPNEFQALRRLGAVTIRVKRGDDPDWFRAARQMEHLPAISPEHRGLMKIIKDSGVHESEWKWASQKVDYVIQNDSSLEDLQTEADRVFAACALGLEQH